MAPGVYSSNNNTLNTASKHRFLEMLIPFIKQINTVRIYKERRLLIEFIGLYWVKKYH
jgi:hypothetical protein